MISEKTVERHRANILEKLGVRDRVQLTRYAIRRRPGRAIGPTDHEGDGVSRARTAIDPARTRFGRANANAERQWPLDCHWRSGATFVRGRFGVSRRAGSHAY